MTYTGQNTFGEICEMWKDCCFNWCIAEAIEIVTSGARNPEEWGDHPYDLYDKEKQLQDYQEQNPEKRKKLVQIYVNCYNKKFKKTIEIPEKKIFIKVKDVEFLIKEIQNIGIDIKNIRNYNDNEIQNIFRQRRVL